MSVEGDRQQFIAPLLLLHELVADYHPKNQGITLDETVFPKVDMRIINDLAETISPVQMAALGDELNKFFSDQSGRMTPPIRRYLPERRIPKRKIQPSPASDADRQALQSKRLRSEVLSNAFEEALREDTLSRMACLCTNPWDATLVLSGAIFAGNEAFDRVREAGIDGLWQTIEYVSGFHASQTPFVVASSNVVRDMDEFAPFF
ncbi:hypothetical protein FRB90_000236 [Tulasnella sp. 427]|nr:hypothetical protein FRB90_000236 [Tulasnella sp. 427]